MKIEATAAQRAKAAPLAHQSHVAEQGRLDGKHIETGHVAARFAALEHQHLQPGIAVLACVLHIRIF